MENAAGLPVRRRLRLKRFPYQGPASYFVTICANEQRCLFGWIEDGQFFPSWIGSLVEREWQVTPHMRRDVGIDSWQVMPNHFHGILHVLRGAHRYRSIVGGFKSAVTSTVRERLNDPSFEVWQRGSFDEVIRSEAHLEQVRRYIAENPAKWRDDPEYVEDPLPIPEFSSAR